VSTRYGILTDHQLLRNLATWLRKHDCLAFDPVDDGEQDRAQVLVEWFAESVDVLNVPPREGEPEPDDGLPPLAGLVEQWRTSAGQIARTKVGTVHESHVGWSIDGDQLRCVCGVAWLE